MKIWTIPNLMSFIRLLLVPFVTYYLYNEKMVVALILIGIAYALDLLDGWVARRFNQISEFGKAFDPFADKVLYGMIALTLVIKKLLPLWFFLFVIVRDGSQLIYGSHIFKKYQRITPSNIYGKIAAFCLAISLLGIILKIPYINPYLLIITTILMFISSCIYIVEIRKFVDEIEHEQ
ncbi:MAG TPA: CDP-alcohol phosphatidyltransferase family protein [Bacteroidota bacterium]|nr:CDP-alcohol phosphatidyltransferase family protein [Candidatus Kapabacteria bacterium]HRS01881.1 CDP-alcohol phosphatidyltransferase family protein [Bacteroidota bacterium]HRT68510.1 CDP-alcohol phosphatidyltransferase family protein [Bacteroidota bacterium]